MVCFSLIIFSCIAQRGVVGYCLGIHKHSLHEDGVSRAFLEEQHDCIAGADYSRAISRANVYNEYDSMT